jgi:hypothetical protein
MEKYEGCVVRFGDDKASIIHGRGSISIDGKKYTYDFLYVEGLKNNILSFGQMVDKGYALQFRNDKFKILSGSINVFASCTKTKANIFHLNSSGEIWLWHRMMSHVNFHNIINISSTQEMRDLYKLMKSINTMCEEC